MIALKIKPIEELPALPMNRVYVMCCEGCKEISYPKNDAIAMINAITVSGTDLTVTELVYMCNEEHLALHLQKSTDLVRSADTILVISCGVGVQVLRELISKNFEGQDKVIIAGCDTYPLPGFQGLTPSNFDCALCGDCHLNETGAICPVTSCSKSLINGECGGAKNGKCEVDSNLECGWERIHKRLANYRACR